MFAIASSEHLLTDLDRAWLPFQDGDLEIIGATLVQELNAFSNAVGVAESIEPQERKSTGWGKALLEKASVVTGSLGDILENLPPYGKHAITLFKEMLDLFKGKG